MARKTVTIDAELEIMIAIPLGELPPDDYEGKQAASGRVSLAQKALHLQAQLGPEAATAFIRIRNGLRSRTERLKDGRPVWSNVDALRWLMEKVAEEAA
jgi:hypothetical protein